MKHKAVSTSSAKDDSGVLDLNEIALAQYADCLGLTDKEYEELKAMSQKRSTNAEAFIAGAFIATAIAAIAIAITHWGWQ